MPSMHDMIDELNDMDCPSYSGSESISNCNYGSNNYGTNNYGFGCGFGSWIWILLILFYAGQGGTANTGCCYGNKGSNNCCCGYNSNSNNGSFYGGGYLFLLVILFLCNGTFGCGNNGCNANYNGALL